MIKLVEKAKSVELEWNQNDFILTDRQDSSETCLRMVDFSLLTRTKRVIVFLYLFCCTRIEIKINLEFGKSNLTSSEDHSMATL